jgi:PPOX class probable F420-dependent enzyme
MSISMPVSFVRAYARRPMGATTLDEMPAWALELLERSRVGRLGLLDDAGRPRVLPVTFALVEDLVYSAIDRKPKRAGMPARVRYLRRRPDCALTVDRYSDDWSELAWVQVLGHVDVVEVREAPDALTALAAKYEPYRAESPPGPLLRLRPERILFWSATRG